jgi:hypothetical protein
MKKHILLIAVLIISCFPGIVNAQVRVGINIGVQPLWGPVGYDHVDYYYIPDVDAYYNVPTQQYTYFEGGVWVTRPYLPPRYRDFDLYHAYKVVLNEPRPWMHHDVYRARYAQFRGRHDQAMIRESHDPRYYENPNHPMHNQWHGHDDHHGDHHDDRHDGYPDYHR